MKKQLALLLIVVCASFFISSNSSFASKALTIKVSKKPLDFNIVKPLSDGGFHDGLLLSEKSDGKVVFYNSKGDIAFNLASGIVPVTDFSEQRAIVKNNKTNLYGFINTKGGLVTPLQYQEAGDFTEGVAHVKLNDSDYLINRFGKIITELSTKYDSSYSFKEGLSLAYQSKTGKAGYINKINKVVIPFNYNQGRDFSEGLALVQDGNGKSGYVNTSGKVVIPFKFKSGGDFNEGIAPVQNKNGKWGYINKNGKEVIPFRFSSAGIFSEGLAAVYNTKGKVGYINKQGKLIINYQQYNRGSIFKQGYALVGIGDNATGKFGFINRKGTLVTKLEYRSESSSFSSNGLAVAFKAPGTAFILTKPNQN
ncbi:hypothetical protein BK138_34075 [Paenibacillus rhizosphaerae]|uniref:WG repeat-containing protein n=1 Tax=Paenibacillus rhizosphaerae TaxID=297318 RepID=A0A1R1DZQ8_9BACL|nr:hypothetical protein BK138_34075 [Paenibacillus rhizosphaerae]